MSEALVRAPESESESFLSSREICPTSTGLPKELVSIVVAIIGIELHPAPGTTVALEEGVGFGWAPGAGGGGAERRRGVGVMPGLLDAVDELPGVGDFVAAGEERGVAAHGVEEQ